MLRLRGEPETPALRRRGKEIYREGIAIGLDRGKILGTIETMRDDGKSNQDIVDRLMKKYSLTQEQAEGYVLSPVTM